MCVCARARAHAHVRVLSQSCPTLCDPMNCSPPGSSVHGILQARILAWAAISSSIYTHMRERDWHDIVNQLYLKKKRVKISKKILREQSPREELSTITSHTQRVGPFGVIIQVSSPSFLLPQTKQSSYQIFPRKFILQA